jgi:hypothetical protein
MASGSAAFRPAHARIRRSRAVAAFAGEARSAIEEIVSDAVMHFDETWSWPSLGDES